MYKKVWKASFVAGAMMISTSCFADLVVDKKVVGDARFKASDRGGRDLFCVGDKGTCYTRYTTGEMTIHHRNGDIFCAPALQQPPTVLVPNPTAPDSYRQIGSINVELMPGQQWPQGD